MLQVLPRFKDDRKLLADEQTTRDIVKEIQAAHKVFARHYDKVVEMWMTGDLSKLPKRLFNFCRQEIKYKEEPKDDQNTLSPAAILTLGKGDCKHYASFIAGILDAVNRTGDYYYDWYYRFVSEKVTKISPHHVFVVIKAEDSANDVWIDPVETIDYFDQRPFYYYHWDKCPSMALHRISGRITGFCNTTTVSRDKVFHAPVSVSGVNKIQAVSPLGAYKPGAIGATGDVYQPVPTGYPSNLPRPVLTADRKLVLRDNLRLLTATEKKWVQQALQPLIIKYAPVPYNIYWSIHGWGSGAADIDSATNPFLMSLTGRSNFDFLQYPKQPSGFDQFLIGLNDILPAIVGTAANYLAPGTGGAAASVVASQTTSTGTNTGVNLTPQQLAAASQPTQTAPGSGVITTVVNYAKNNPIPALLIGAGVGYGLYKLFK